MGLEVASYIADLVATNPLASDAVGQGDDHLRLLKSTLQATFPNLGNRYARVISGATGYTVLSSDNSAVIEIPAASGATTTHTFSLPALSSITAGFYFEFFAKGPTDVGLVVPTGGASIEGAATLSVGPKVAARIYYDGTTWRALKLPAYGFNDHDLSLTGGLTISGATRLGSTLTVSGATHLQSTLSVSGVASFLSAVTISGGLTLGSTLSVSGGAHFKSGVSISGNIAIDGTLRLSGATASISAAVHMHSTLSVSSSVQFGSTMSVGGAATFASTVTISGTCVLTSGQLKFPASQNASSDANVLDDYEEGTWTPVITFATPGNLAVTYTTQGGDYTKIGRQVCLTTNIVTATFTHTTASSEVRITGLPFGCNVSNDGLWMHEGITKANYQQFSMHLDGGGDVIMAGRASGSGQLYTSVNAADMPTATQKIVFCTHNYHAS